MLFKLSNLNYYYLLYLLETVRSHKVLGLVIQDNLKWNENPRMIVSKASKRLHIIRVLRRGGVSAADLLDIYVALVRSVREYCCVVWHNVLPAYLSIAHDYSVRNSNSWTSFKCKTERFRRSFFSSTVLMANATSFKN